MAMSIDDDEGSVLRFGVRGLILFVRGGRGLLGLAVLVMHSYLLGVLNTHSLPVSHNIVAAEALLILAVAVDAATLFLSCGALFDCFSKVTMALGVFITAVYVYTAAGVYGVGVHACHGYADTLYGDVAGSPGLPTVGLACGMQKASLALCIVGA